MDRPAIETPPTPSADATRRGFLDRAAQLLAGVPLLGGAVLALRGALAPAASDRPSRVALCRVKDLPPTPGTIVKRSVHFDVRRGPRTESVTRSVFVRKDADGSIHALSAKCTHLGCPVVLRDDEADAPLYCACHAGRFAPTGEVVSGPPGRPLDALALELPPDPADGQAADPNATIWLLDP